MAVPVREAPVEPEKEALVLVQALARAGQAAPVERAPGPAELARAELAEPGNQALAAPEPASAQAVEVAAATGQGRAGWHDVPGACCSSILAAVRRSAINYFEAKFTNSNISDFTKNGRIDNTGGYVTKVDDVGAGTGVIQVSMHAMTFDTFIKNGLDSAGSYLPLARKYSGHYRFNAPAAGNLVNLTCNPLTEA